MLGLGRFAAWVTTWGAYFKWGYKKQQEESTSDPKLMEVEIDNVLHLKAIDLEDYKGKLEERIGENITRQQRMKEAKNAAGHAGSEEAKQLKIMQVLAVKYGQDKALLEKDLDFVRAKAEWKRFSGIRRDKEERYQQFQEVYELELNEINLDKQNIIGLENEIEDLDAQKAEILQIFSQAKEVKERDRAQTGLNKNRTSIEKWTKIQQALTKAKATLQARKQKSHRTTISENYNTRDAELEMELDAQLGLGVTENPVAVADVVSETVKINEN